MKVEYYYDPDTKGFYQTDINQKIPKTAVKITKDLKQEFLEGLSLGNRLVVNSGEVSLIEPDCSDYDEAIQERVWRDSELKRADIELFKVQDSDSKAVGTVAQWREYRKALRAWPEHKDFPNKEKRPVSPDA